MRTGRRRDDRGWRPRRQLEWFTKGNQREPKAVPERGFGVRCSVAGPAIENCALQDLSARCVASQAGPEPPSTRRDPPGDPEHGLVFGSVEVLGNDRELLDEGNAGAVPVQLGRAAIAPRHRQGGPGATRGTAGLEEEAALPGSQRRIDAPCERDRSGEEQDGQDEAEVHDRRNVR